MGVNSDKYYYINRVGLVRNSWAHKQLEKDLEDNHMQEMPGKLVALRLTEYYRLVERLANGGMLPLANGVLAPVGAGAGAGAEAAKLAPLTTPMPTKTYEEDEDDDQDEGTPTAASVDEDLLDDSDDVWSV